MEVPPSTRQEGMIQVIPAVQNRPQGSPVIVVDADDQEEVLQAQPPPQAVPVHQASSAQQAVVVSQHGGPIEVVSGGKQEVDPTALMLEQRFTRKTNGLRQLLLLSICLHVR